MGRAPVPYTKQDERGFQSVGAREMLEALESALKATEEGCMGTEDYYFKFTTAVFNKQSGSCNGSHLSSKTALSSEMILMVKTTFQDVENGFVKEGDYYFKLTTPHFHCTSGCYPLHDKDEYTSSDDKQEPVPCILWVHFSLRLDVGWKRLLCYLSLIKELLAVWMHRARSKKKISGISLGLIMLHVLSVRVDASSITETEQPLTLTAGLDGTIPFECSNEHQSDVPNYYTVTLEGKDRPFYLDGAVDPDGLMSPDQVERFTVVYDENDNVMSIEIHIASVTVEDQGTYIVMVIIPGEIPEPRLMKKIVIIYIPPGPAACFILPSPTVKDKLEIHCHSKRGNSDSTLTCFQNNAKIPYVGTGGQIVYRRVFWLMYTNAPVSCCAHDIKEIRTITEAMCNQFTWPQTHVIINPDQTEKVPTKMALSTGPSYNDKQIKQTTVHSGCAKNLFNWSNAMIPLMTVVAHACMFNL